MTEEERAANELARKHLNTARSLAHQMRLPTEAADFDDLVQEGAVAAWQATLTDRDDPVRYGMVVARNRIRGHLRGRLPMYGSEREGRTYDQSRQVTRREDIEDLAEIAYERSVFLEIERRIDVERALAVLSPRDLEIARLVSEGGWGWEEIAAHVGLSKAGCFNRWRYHVKPVLVERLSAIRAA